MILASALLFKVQEVFADKATVIPRIEFPESNCIWILGNHLDVAGKSGFENDLSVDIRNQSRGTVYGDPTRMGSVLPRVSYAGEYGGRVYVAERELRRSWESNSSSLRIGIALDLQGDPRDPIVILGHDLAEIFGVSVVSRHRLAMADAEETNQRISAFNAYLIPQGLEPIQASFYVKSFKDVWSRLEYYLEAFATKGAMPTELPTHEWNHFTHDVTFHRHFGAVAPEVRELLQKSIGHQLKFWKFAKSFFEDHLTPQLAVVAKRALLYEMALRLDLAHARLMQGGVNLIADPIRQSHRAIPGRFIRGVERPGSAIKSLEERGYQEELVLAFDIESMWVSNGGAPTVRKFNTATSSPKAIIENIIKMVEGKKGLTEERLIYLFGTSDVKSPLVSTLLETSSSVWSAAWSEYLQSPQLNQDLSAPLIANESDLERLSHDMAIRRLKLMRAARDYHRTKLF